jgi:large subunit ribosomal protein L13
MTKPTKITDIKRAWYLFDVEGKILGRVVSEIATTLMGKSKPYYVNSLDCGDNVVVINAEKVKVTGRKELQRMYFHHSGYPGGDRKETLMDLRKRKPEDIIKETILGMLPQNKLRDRIMTRLFVFKGPEHKYADKFNNQKPEVKSEAKTEKKV